MKVVESNNTYEISDFIKFKATGVDMYKHRISPIISENYYYIEGINLWHGHKWGLTKVNNKWKLLQSIHN